MTAESPDMLMHSICCNTVLTEVQEEDVVSWTCGCVLSCFSHVRLCATLWTVARQVPLSNWDSPGMDTRVGCHALLQEIFPTQRSNPGLLRCQQILYHLSHEGSPGLLDTQKRKRLEEPWKDPRNSGTALRLTSESVGCESGLWYVCATLASYLTS